MRAFTRTHPRGPETHICPEFCRKLSEPARSERGWTEGSNELPRTSRRFTIERSTLRDVLVLERPINAVLARCAQCDGALVFAARAAGCPGCKWYSRGARARRPLRTGTRTKRSFSSSRHRDAAASPSCWRTRPPRQASAPQTSSSMAWPGLKRCSTHSKRTWRYARLDPATTYWVCDYVIRQGGIDDCAGSRREPDAQRLHHRP